MTRRACIRKSRSLLAAATCEHQITTTLNLLCAMRVPAVGGKTTGTMGRVAILVRAGATRQRVVLASAVMLASAVVADNKLLPFPLLVEPRVRECYGNNMYSHSEYSTDIVLGYLALAVTSVSLVSRLWHPQQGADHSVQCDHKCRQIYVIRRPCQRPHTFLSVGEGTRATLRRQQLMPQV